MLRNKAVFGEDADMFRPERFIECHDEDTKARMFKVIDLSFGHGRWMCLGKALAWMELNKVFVEVSANCQLLSELLELLAYHHAPPAPEEI